MQARRPSPAVVWHVAYSCRKERRKERRWGEEEKCVCVCELERARQQVSKDKSKARRASKMGIRQQMRGK